MEGSEVTVTGATGLVGLNIVCALLHYNKHFAKKPISINALSYSCPDELFSRILQNNNIKSINGDLSDCDFVKSIPMSDYIIHSAGYGQPGKFLDNKIQTISINTIATIGLFKKLNNGGSFLYLSSSEIYSGSDTEPNTEGNIGTTTPSHPRASYIEGKRCGEAIINSYRESGVNASSARLALAYGPGVKAKDQRVLNQFVEKGFNGLIRLLDNGDAIRTYGYISDVVVMLLNILTKGKRPVYNIGGKSIVSIKELAESIGKEMNASVETPTHKKSFMDEAPKKVGLDLSKVEEDFSHSRYIGLDKGLKNTIKWIQNYE
jgi:nucleoside-diphosphate-sugar epimerase